MSRLSTYADAFGIRHKTTCQQRKFIYRDRQDTWTCKSCGQRAHDAPTTTTKETR